MGSGFAKKKKQARAFQEQLTKMQSELQEQMQKTEVVGTAGNGLVTIVLSGEYEMKSISIKPDCIDKEDAEGLQDLIQAAYNDAAAKLQEQQKVDMPQMPGMPGGLQNMFGLT